MKHCWTIQATTFPLIGKPGTERNLRILLSADDDLKLDEFDAKAIARAALVNVNYVCRDAVVTKDS